MNRFGDSVLRQDSGETDLRDNILDIHVKILQATDDFETQINGISKKFDELYGRISGRLAALEEKLTDIKLETRLTDILQRKNITPAKFAESAEAQTSLRKIVASDVDSRGFVDDVKLNNAVQQALTDISPKKFAESADARPIWREIAAAVIDENNLPDSKEIASSISTALENITPKKFAESADAKAILQKYIADDIVARSFIDKSSFDNKVDEINGRVKTLSDKIAGRRKGRRRLRNLRATAAETHREKRRRRRSESV